MTVFGTLLENLWSVLLYSCLGVKVFTEKATAAIPQLTTTGVK